MQAGPSGFDEALASRSADTLTVHAVVATPGDDVASASGWAEALVIERQMSGELPPSASDVVGGVSATLRVDGDANGAAAPVPMRDAASWLTSQVDVRLGYGGLEVPVFSGRVSRLDAAEGDGSLRVDARDASERLTVPVRLRPYGSVGVFRHPTNTAGVIVSILHANGIRVTPAPRSTSCELSVPGVGGWLADIGWTVPRGASVSSTWTAGRFGPAAAANPDGSAEIIVGYLANRRAFVGNSTMFEAWVRVVAGQDIPQVLRLASYVGEAVTLDVTAGAAAVVWRRDLGTSSTLISAPVSAGWHHLCVEVGPIAYAKLWIDGVEAASSTSPWPGGATTSDVDTLRWSPGVQAVAVYWREGQVNTPAQPTSAVVGFVSEADVSLGALDLVSIPDVDGRESWAVAQEIAQAELGMVGFSEAGRFFFRSRADLAAVTVPVATWGVDLVDDVRPTVSADALITRVTAKVRSVTGTPWAPGPDNDKPSVVADAPDSGISIPVGTSSVLVTSSTPLVVDTQAMSVITTAAGAWQAPAAVVLCYSASGATRYTGGQVRAWLSPVSMTSWRVTFVNSSGFVLYAAWPSEWVTDNTPFGMKAGDPGLWINGTAFETGKAVELVVDRSNTAGVTAWGTRTHELAQSPWRQDAARVATFVDGLLADTSKPRAQVSDITVPADPRWQIGDPVRVSDWRGKLPGFVARITSVRLTVSRDVENGIVGTYGLRQIPGTLPRVTAQPADASVFAGDDATFAVAASDVSSYQWQQQPRPGATWTPIPGATGASYTRTGVALSDNGSRYRCNVIGPTGDDWTRAARLTVS